MTPRRLENPGLPGKQVPPPPQLAALPSPTFLEIPTAWALDARQGTALLILTTLLRNVLMLHTVSACISGDLQALWESCTPVTSLSHLAQAKCPEERSTESPRLTHSPSCKSVLAHCKRPRALVSGNLLVIENIFNTLLMTFPLLLGDKMKQ